MHLSEQHIAKQHHRRHLETVSELAERYRMPKTSMYDYLRANPQAGVVRIGRRVLVDVVMFDRFVSAAAPDLGGGE